MKYVNLAEELRGNTYPGRGIVLGRSEDGKKAVIAYFIMGRSENSRNRVFVEQDPSLIIYAPVRVLGKQTVVTNGDQTDTIYDFLKEGKSFEEALRTRTFEPDAPNFTPRISGLVEGFDYKLSILKSNNNDSSSTRRYFFEYTDPKAGEGHFIHTYKCDGSPIPSYEGEPTPVVISGDIDAFTNEIWENLNADNKVSLFTRFIDVESGEVETRIINKNK